MARLLSCRAVRTSVTCHMGQEALRDLWTQLPLGPLRKNASVMTMRLGANSVTAVWMRNSRWSNASGGELIRRLQYSPSNR